MGFEAELRAEILRSIVQDVPAGFWADLEVRSRWVYEESYDSNTNDPRIRPTQAHFKIISDRFYFFEAILAEIADSNLIIALPEEIKVNTWRYTLLRANRISATAKYVYSSGDVGTPSHFRMQLAAANSFNRSPPIPGLLESPPLKPEAINGIIIHGPMSRDFQKAEFRHLGFLHFAIPWDDYSGWAANFPISEIRHAYESRQERRPDPKPKWKPIRKPDDSA